MNPEITPAYTPPSWWQEGDAQQVDRDPCVHWGESSSRMAHAYVLDGTHTPEEMAVSLYMAGANGEVAVELNQIDAFPELFTPLENDLGDDIEGCGLRWVGIGHSMDDVDGKGSAWAVFRCEFPDGLSKPVLAEIDREAREVA